jgi:hypothetical protein
MYHDTDVALKETIKEKVERRNKNANIMLQMIELAKKLDVRCSEIADKLRYPEHICEKDIAHLQSEIDREFWRDLFNELQVEKFLTSSDKEKVFKKIEENTPVFDLDSAYSTMFGFMNSKEATATNMITKIHKNITDIVFRVGNSYKSDNEKRIQRGVPKSFRASIFYSRDGLPSYISSSRSNFELIDDLERACYLIDGKTQPDYHKAIRSKTDLVLRERGDTVNNDYFEMKMFKNGNVKITFTNQEVLNTFNKWGRTGNALE